MEETMKGMEKLRNRESTIHVVDDAYSVVTDLVDWILWRLVTTSLIHLLLVAAVVVLALNLLRQSRAAILRGVYKAPRRSPD